MTRRCSHCSNNGHNSRTCPARGGVKLFGVRLTDGSIRKSASMGCLSSAAHFHSPSSAAEASPNPSSPSSDPLRDPTSHQGGYASDDPNNASNCRKKGPILLYIYIYLLRLVFDFPFRFLSFELYGFLFLLQSCYNSLFFYPCFRFVN